MVSAAKVEALERRIFELEQLLAVRDLPRKAMTIQIDEHEARMMAECGHAAILPAPPSEWLRRRI